MGLNMLQIIEKIIKETDEYEAKWSKKFRKEKSQFFTPITIANYMIELFDFKSIGNELKILDPSGGTGILSLVLLLYILENHGPKKIVLDIYEIDNNVLEILDRNAELVREEYNKSNIDLKINIYNANFINCFDNNRYDLIIANPPYKKVKKDSEEAQVVKELLYGQPNLYMIFMVQSLKLLKNNGQSVFIVPRSFFNGKYFMKFRKWLYNNFYINYIHSFESRNKIMNDEVLQELVIIKISKSSCDQVMINHSNSDKDIDMDKGFTLPKNLVWNGGDTQNIRLPIDMDDVKLLIAFDKLDQTMEDLGLKFKTGPIVDFRVKENLRDVKSIDSFPLIWSANFSNIYIQWPLNNTKFKQHIISKDKTDVLLPMGDYILVKRFSSKEEGKSLHLNVLRKESFDYNFIGIENHVNYLKFSYNTKKIMKGIFILLNSTFYNRYFKIINGTTQINTTDLNNLPVPSLKILEEISQNKLDFDQLTTDKCNLIINKYFNLK